MTRKCILCQETNYKTKYSFFSAPKDAPTRKKWKEALGIPSVCDETYVCSKHFDDRDIISSWASGTPPHVVTIHYKKCRLRPGAVPTTKKNSRQYCVPTTRKDNQYFIHEKHDGDDDEEDDEEEKEENQQQIMKKEIHDKREEENHNQEDEKEEEEEYIETKKPATRSSMRKTLPVPPAKVNNNNNKLKATAKKTNDKPNIKKPVSKNGTVVSKTRAAAAGDGDNNCQEKMITEPIDIIEPANMDVDDNGDKSAFYIKTGDTQQLYYIKPVDENSKTDDDGVDNSKDRKVEKNPLIKLENVKYIEDDDEDEEDEEDEDDDDDDDDDDEYPMWKKIKAETKKKAKIISKTSASKIPASKTSEPKIPASKISEPKKPVSKISEPKIPASKLSQLQIPTSKILEQKMTAQKLLEAQTPASKILEPKITEAQIAAAKINYAEEEEDDGMLFEDLLETYTDVTLPSGWCVLVESRGDVTTVIYAYIETTSGGIPWIRKQVFIQNDMLMRTSAGGREIDPIVYKLIKGTKSVQVTDVDDVTDIIREFDERTVCQGTSEKINPVDMDNTIGYLDGVNWRHVECSIMIKPGQARCTKCNSLNAIAKRKKTKLP